MVECRAARVNFLFDFRADLALFGSTVEERRFSAA
jgi:hypothetical protein